MEEKPVQIPPEATPINQHTSKTFLKKYLWVIVIYCSVLIVLIIAILLFVNGHQKSGQNIFNNQNKLQTSDANDCSGTVGLLKFSPVQLSDIATIVPLGNMQPPSHVLPTVHMYFNYLSLPGNNVRRKTTIYAPADMTINTIWLFDNNSSPYPFNSYRIDFTICNQVSGYFIHVITLNDKLTAAMKPPYDRIETSNVGVAKPDHNYIKNVHVTLKAGEILGTAGGESNLPDGLDFALQDSRVSKPVQANPARWQGGFPQKALNNIRKKMGGIMPPAIAERLKQREQEQAPYVCSLDYLPTDLANELYKKIGGFDNVAKNPGDPKCGTAYQDIPGAAQGDWFSKDIAENNSTDVNSQLTLGSWNLDHTFEVFSMGNKLNTINLPSSYLLGFTPKQNGMVSLDFKFVKPGSIYCYDTVNLGQTNHPNGPSVLIQLTDASHLRIGSLSGSNCGNGPWSFTNFLEYVR